ncbi:Rne/Rng family ribonuclease [Actinomyces urogenitalis]|uniref:Rne/Rng family ribonuclease n=1 Tax=Actinomyces urogenitalis TaxID=103621 RepID=UPI0025509370|nr:Rne/Rng family ribonuclease [Actinomyces urogenitalis]MDK8237124.1 Rne/Rng family ribonuclease [Actinomyces urogenitalis]WOO94476.1 Rne/Rng family ribonuclease [Actinomyces urogenitalis]
MTTTSDHSSVESADEQEPQGVQEPASQEPAAEEPAKAPAKRTRRTTTRSRKTATKTSSASDKDEAAEKDDKTADPQEPEQGAAEEAPKARSRSKSSTRKTTTTRTRKTAASTKAKASAKGAEATESDLPEQTKPAQEESQTTAPVAAAEPETGATTRRPRRSRKVTATQSAPAPAPQPQDEVVPVAPGSPSPAASSSQDEEEVVSRSRSTTRRRRRVMAVQAASDAAPVVETIVAPEDVEEASDEEPAAEVAAPTAEQDALQSADSASSAPSAPSADQIEEDEEDDDVEESPAQHEDEEAEAFLPAASLLFQAPDPTRARRRRKATAAQSAPEHAPEPEEASAPAEPDEASQEETEDQEDSTNGRRKRRRGGRGRRSRSRAEASETEKGSEPEEEAAREEREDSEPQSEEPGQTTESAGEEGSASSRRRRRRRSRSRSDSGRDVRDEVTALKGSTRLEAKRQRRREGRAAGRRRPIVTEAEFLARRESVDRQMIVREQDGLNQIAILEDGMLVEHYVARHTQTSMVGNVYVGRVQNVLPSMEAAFVDLGKGRNAVLYAGEVNWDAAGMEGKPRRIEDALKSGDTVLVQVTKDPIGHKGARLTSQITLAGRYLVLVPGGTMTGISRKLPDTERHRLKGILKRIVPDDAGVIVRTAAEGASEEQLRADVERLATQWAAIDKKSKQILSGSGRAPVLLKGEPELAVRVVRDVFNEDFRKLIVQGPDAWKTISEYVTELSPDLADRLEHWVSPEDVFSAHRIDEQLAKGFDRKVWLPSGGTLIIDRTEAMTVIDVNTGRFTGAGGTLEETVTRNNIEAAEEIVRQLRLRDIGGMVVIDFVDMVLESNRDLVLRRLVECLGRDRTRHQVTEVTSLGLVQMTRKRVGQGLVEAFSTPCECCGGRGFIVHDNPVENQQADMSVSASRSASKSRRGKGEGESGKSRGRGRKGPDADDVADDATRAAVRGALAQIAAAAEHAHKDAAEQAEAAGSQDSAAQGDSQSED